MLKRNEMRVHQQRLCLYCPIAFSNESHLEKHLRDHHAERLYTSELITPDFETDGSERICVKLSEDVAFSYLVLYNHLQDFIKGYSQIYFSNLIKITKL